MKDIKNYAYMLKTMRTMVAKLNEIVGNILVPAGLWAENFLAYIHKYLCKVFHSRIAINGYSA